MAPRRPRATVDSPPSAPDLAVLAQSFRLSLLAANRAPRTVETYMEALGLFERFLQWHRHAAPRRRNPPRARSRPRSRASSSAGSPRPRRRAASRASSSSSSGASTRGSFGTEPMRNMSPPKVPEKPPDVLTEEDSGGWCTPSRDRLRGAPRHGHRPPVHRHRDAARGPRRAGASSDLDLEQAVQAYVMGKGRRGRACPFGRRTAQALNRYSPRAARAPRCRGRGALGWASPDQ